MLCSVGCKVRDGHQWRTRESEEGLGWCLRGMAEMLTQAEGCGREWGAET